MAEHKETSKLLIPSLVISREITALPNLVTGLLLIDIGETFNTPVGISGQIRSTSSALSIIFALLMGAISLRYRHKSLLTTGLLFYTISAAACGLAPNFTIMLIVFALNGLAFALVNPMIVSLIGELIPREKRTTIIGYTISGLALFYVAGSLLSSYIANLAGWRWAFIGLVFPLSAISLVLSLNAIPSLELRQSSVQKGDIMAGFKSVAANRSALACVVGTSLGVASWNFYLIYTASFWRQEFNLSTGFVSVAYILTAFGYISGSLLSGRAVKRVGNKTMVVVTSLFLGLATVIVTFPRVFWVTYGVSIFVSLCGGMMITGFTRLTLEQIPSFRGTMMSVSSAATSFGQLLCASLGGFLLLRYSYNVCARLQHGQSYHCRDDEGGCTP